MTRETKNHRGPAEKNHHRHHPSMEASLPSAEMIPSSDDESSLGSVHGSHGIFDGHDEPWRGCVCHKIHPRPAVVFWIRCDGHCRSWYNVLESCVGFDAAQASSLCVWFCPDCSATLSPQLRLFLNLPDVLLYKILTFCANDRAAVLCHTIAPLCSATRHAVNHEPWSSLWSIVLQRDFQTVLHFDTNTYRRHTVGATAAAAVRPKKRRRGAAPSFAADAIHFSKDQVQRLYESLCADTEDAHMALAATAKSQSKPLSLKRLRNILSSSTIRTTSAAAAAAATPGVSWIQARPSSATGRTLVMLCCAADYVDERVVLRCIQELVQHHGAAQSIHARTTQEEPYANRTALFFAVARVMPSVVQYLIQIGGARVNVRVQGRHRCATEPSKSFTGSFTPLGLALRLKEEETLPSCYWAKKLNQCIQILKENGGEV